jgi:retron-type reverse transcriptase
LILVRELILNKECILSVYVDDITISGCNATKSLLWDIRKVIHGYGYQTSNKKSKFYSKTQPKMVTGVVIRDNKPLLPNRRHKKINDVLQQYFNSQNQITSLQLRTKYEAMKREADKIINFTLS